MNFQQELEALIKKANVQEKCILKSMAHTTEPFSDEVELLNNIHASIEEREHIARLQSDILQKINKIKGFIQSISYFPQDSALNPNFDNIGDIDSFLSNLDIVQETLQILDSSDEQISRLLNKIETLKDYQANGVPNIDREPFAISDFQIPESTIQSINVESTPALQTQTTATNFESALQANLKSLYIRAALAFLPFTVVAISAIYKSQSASQISAQEAPKSLYDDMSRPSVLLMSANRDGITIDTPVKMFSDLVQTGGALDKTLFNIPQLVVIANDYAFGVLGLNPKKEVRYKIELQNIRKDDPGIVSVSAVHPADRPSNSNQATHVKLRISGYVLNNKFHPTGLETHSNQ